MPIEVKSKYYDLKTQSWKEITICISNYTQYDYSNVDWVTIDGEFTGLYPQRDKDVLWTIASEYNNNLRVEMVYVFNNNANFDSIKNILVSENIEKIFWYGLLDIAFLIKRTGIIPKQPIFDVKLASKLIRTYTQDHNIDVLLVNLFNAPTDITNKKEMKASKEFALPLDEWSINLHQYNVNDVIYLKPIADKLKKMAKFINREELLNSVNRALPEIAFIQANGFYRDIFHPFYNDTDMNSGTIIPSRK